MNFLIDLRIIDSINKTIVHLFCQIIFTDYDVNNTLIIRNFLLLLASIPQIMII